MKASFRIAAPILLGLAGCSWPGPSLQGQPGLQYDVISFYNGRAMERGNVTTCRDWSERTFTFARDSSGKLQVVGMNGGQKSS
jgi:hypothetical protein